MAKLPSKPLAVILTAHDKSAEGIINLGFWTRGAAWKRAFFCFSVIYFIGGLSQVNPIVHFLLPPLWLMVGPYVAHRVYKAYVGGFELIRGSGTCPICSQATMIVPMQDILPFPTKCKLCNEGFNVSLSPNESLESKKEELLTMKENQPFLDMLPAALRKPQIIDQSFLLLTYFSIFAFAVACFIGVVILGEVIFNQTSSFKTLNESASIHSLGTLGHLLLAVIVIIGAAKLSGHLFAKLRQPPVMGEVIAGIFLGPSVLGAVSPSLSGYLFPAVLMPAISGLSQIGIVIFMFLVGVELDTKLFRNRIQASVAISHISIVVPFLAGGVLALALYSSFAPKNTSFLVFSMFLGTAMSVTAFPILARILTDLRITGTSLATIALSCAAIDDITAWCLLAIVTGLATAQLGQGLITLGLTLVFCVFMMIYGKRLIHYLAKRSEEGELTTNTIALTLIIAFLSALVTEIIGIHALFGAFLVGVFIPKDSRLAKFIYPRLSHIVSVFLLPLFFVQTGFNTQIGLLNSVSHWFWCLLVIVVASISKIGGAAVAAKVNGFSKRESLSIGVLMNTRGLMELVVLNLGLEMGIISQGLFTIMVLMAVVTTLMTTPLFTSLMGKESSYIPTSTRLVETDA